MNFRSVADARIDTNEQATNNTAHTEADRASHWWNWRAWRADAAPLATILVFFLLFFSWALFTGRFPLGGDSLVYSVPLRTVAWQMIRQGEMPLWTPLIMSGYPLFSMASLGFGYPLTWFYLFLPGHWAEEIYVFAPFLLTPAFTYFYMRELGRSRPAALLAGFVFAYGGMMASGLTNNGYMSNCVMWTPLALLALERALYRPFLRCLLGATAAYTMSVLTGYGQGFVHLGILLAAYALLLAFINRPVANVHGRKSVSANDDDNDDSDAVADLKFRRWRPLAVVCAAGLLSVGVSAFQILESLRAVRRSVRNELSYEIFSEGSFTFAQAYKALFAPLHFYIDVTPYVPPLALLLCVVAVYAWFKESSQRESRVMFWLIVALFSWLLMLGDSTPFYRLIYHVPVLNLFRVPSRYAYEWTFAAGVLAAYGWDYLGARRRISLVSRSSDAHIASDETNTSKAVAAGESVAPTQPTLHQSKLSQSTLRNLLSGRAVAIGLLLASSVIAALWLYHATRPFIEGASTSSEYTSIGVPAYIYWKILFTLTTFAALWQARALLDKRFRRAALTVGLCLVCFVESFIFIYCWWGLFVAPGERFSRAARTTSVVAQFAPAENRVYTYVKLFTDVGPRAAGRVDSMNLWATHGIQNVAGYEPLILERYSRALGGVGLDTITMRRGFERDVTMFGSESHVLDLLNARYLIASIDLQPIPYVMPLVVKDGVNFSGSEAALEIKPGHTHTVSGAPSFRGDTLYVVTSLANSMEIPQNETVARLRINTTDGRIIERELRAGADTSEWAHERADVRAAIKHELAPVFDSPATGDPNFKSYRYLARVPLGASVEIKSVEIKNNTEAAKLAIFKASLADTVSGASQPLSADFPLMLDASRWEKVESAEGIMVARNLRALPRAWLVAEAQSVEGEEALQMIRGAGASKFDPRRRALLETAPAELPALPGGDVSVNARVKMVDYHENRLALEVANDKPSLLVLSEIFYPGWQATIDGQPAKIYLTDYLLRSVYVPAGTHRVEMRYASSAIRTGFLITLLTLVLLGALWLYSRRRGGSRHAQKASAINAAKLNSNP